MKDSVTPMMKQYLGIKAQHRDAVLFFRLGDFYEMFNDDAVEVSRILNLTLTQRGGYRMCGIPYHASKIYISRLLRAGKKIAICEQVSAPVPGELTERKVVEIITPGTVVETDFLDAGENNYLAAIFCSNKQIKTGAGIDYECGFAYIDVSTGDFFGTTFLKSKFTEEFVKELGRIKPNEILIQQSLFADIPDLKSILNEYPEMLQNIYPDWSFIYDVAVKRLLACFKTDSLKAFSLTSESAIVPPAGLILEYLEQTSGSVLSHIDSISVYTENDFLSLDDSTRKNLELLYNLRDNTSAYTLFDVINHTKTGMGTRLLRYYVYHPLCKKNEIAHRLNQVEMLYKNNQVLNSIRKVLSNILDIERLTGRIAMERAHGKDLLALKQSLNYVLNLVELSKQENMFFLKLNEEEITTLNNLYNTLENSINEDCSILFTEGKLIKAGWSQELDDLKNLKSNVHSVLEEYLESEKEKTGIQKIKLKYNKINGYFLEISKSNLDTVPEHFTLVKHLINASRFSTKELYQLENKIKVAEDQIIELEKRLFADIIAEINSKTKFLHFISAGVAKLDVIQSFAQTAIKNKWTKPDLNETGLLEIIEGRHPVVEANISSEEFIPNDTYLTSDENQLDIPVFALITGPNMAGKSTFLRQTALIVLLAQIGSFVPAKQANISICDKIFCRVGASDNLARGESTFLVEMTETAYILRNATQQSLVIMDEVGRGTSTEDGLAIAQAISEYLLNVIKAKTLFATHYHELSDMKHPSLINLCLDVLETDGKIVFLKKVIKGKAQSSYGIHVAGLAGIPQNVLRRAENLIHIVNQKKVDCPIETKVEEAKKTSIELFSEEEMILNELLTLDPNELPPIKALEILDRWKNTLMNK